VASAQTSRGNPSQPFQQQVDLAMAPGGSATFGFVNIPRGMRLVIQFVSVSGAVPQGQKVNVTLNTTVNNATASYALQTSQVSSATPGTDSILANQMMLVYADNTGMATVLVNRQAGEGICQMSVSVSGYLVDIS
jgi:hypothetical protein